MELIIGLILSVVALGGVGLFALWAQDTIPRKINEVSAQNEISKFENSPAALYAVSQIVNNMSIEIMNEARPKTCKTIHVYYMFNVEEHQVHGRATTEYDCDWAGITGSWSYDFCENRYPDLKRDAERTALATVIARKAVTELRKKFPKDKSGSTDVSITYSEQFNYGHIKIHYKATNNFYEELKSW